jgi:hypothetical protein
MVRRLRPCQRPTHLSVVPGVVWVLLMMASILVHAEQCTGTVVGLSDGATSSV